MKKIILYYVLSLCLISSLVYTDTYLGYVRQIDASFCMDVCSEYYLEDESGEYLTNITFAFGSYDPLMYIDRFVEVEGEEIWCVECGAIEIEETNISGDCENPVFCFADPCEVAPDCELNTPVECVSTYCGGCYGDFSDSVFVLTDNIIEPYLQVLHPNGGEVLTIGSQVDILWESNLGSCSWGMDISLIKGNDSVLTINYGPTDSGIYEWQIPGTLEPADNYKIFIESLCYGGGSYCDGCHGDESDDSFRVVDN